MSAAGTVIVGAGQGGYQAAASLREYGYAEPITVVGDEPAWPYQRPPLSKAYLLGDTTAERLLLRPQSYYAQHKIDVVVGGRARHPDFGQDARLRPSRAGDRRA
jgi:3-phenylpropionate/trans-cinnamate dioxygenase ferredoxin reductase subunit